MLYKTIILELLQQRTQLYEQLRSTRTLQSTLETCAQELTTRHEFWKDTLSQANPGRDPSQLASEALELALKEMEDRLSSGSQRNESAALSLDEAMAYIRSHTPHD